jgi:hypothetical protein
LSLPENMILPSAFLNESILSSAKLPIIFMNNLLVVSGCENDYKYRDSCRSCCSLFVKLTSNEHLKIVLTSRTDPDALEIRSFWFLWEMAHHVLFQTLWKQAMILFKKCGVSHRLIHGFREIPRSRAFQRSILQ